VFRHSAREAVNDVVTSLNALKIPNVLSITDIIKELELLEENEGFCS
jgi:hypothetical protein